MKSIFKVLFLSLCIIANTHLAFAQTASILPQGKTQFLDNNGKPLTSGTVDFYIPSTTTRKTTWQNSAETIANANPVVLDAGGRAIIYGDGAYRQVVKDRLGNIIWDQVTSSTGSGSGGSTATGDGDLVGTIKPWAGMTAPNQYVFTYGQEISRTTYSALFTAITSSQSVFCTSGSPTLTGLSDTTNFWVGASVEVSCLAAGFSTIISKTSSSITLASNANVSTNVTAIIFPWGRGNGTTTFNVPDLRGFAIAGNNNMGGVASSQLNTTYFGATDPNSVGAAGGNQSTSITLLTANLPAYTPAGTIAVTATVPFTQPNTGNIVTPGGVTFTQQNLGTTPVTITGQTFTGTPAPGQISTPILKSIVQPTRTSNYIIKITPDANSATASGVTSLGGMTGDIACGTGTLCTGNIISVSISSLTYTAPYTGGVSQTISSKLAQTINAKDFGTNVCTGSDDTTAISNAIAASQSAGGAIVQLPGGTCRVSCIGAACNIFTSTSAVNIRGVGNGAGPGPAAQSNSNVTQLLIQCTNCTLFNITSAYPSIFKDFQVNVDPANRPHTGNAIYLAGTGTSTVANFWVENVGFTNVGTPIRALRPGWGTITKSYFDSWENHAIYCETSTGVEGSCGFINKNYFFGTLATTTSPIYSEVGYAIIDGNEILGGPQGINLNYKNFPAGFTKITNNTIENYSSVGISASSSDGSVASMLMIQNNEFSEVTQAATAAISINEYVATPIWIKDILIQGNISRNYTKAGAKHFWVQAGQNVQISGNIIEELAANNATAIQVTGSTINTGLAAPFTIFDNVITGTTSKYSLASDPAAQLRDVSGMTVASIPSNIGNGSQIYTTDGLPSSNPLTGSSTGTMAFRENGAWVARAGLSANQVGNAQLRQSAALSLVGRSANSLGNVADVSATAASDCVFRESGSTVGCGTVATAGLAANAVTYAKLQQVAASSLVGNATGSLANATGITLGATLAFSGSSLQTAALTGDVTTSANSFATTIAANAVTLSKLAAQGANTVLSNATSGSAVPTAFSMPSCSTSASALNWTSNAGFGCNSAISAAVANVTGLGTGVGSALAINIGSAGAPVLFNGALGTPSSGTLTSATGLPISTGVSGLGAGVATLLSGASSGTGGPVGTTSPAFAAGATFVNAITPSANDGAALGSTSLSWSDLFLASGGVINWNNGTYTLTQASGVLRTSGNVRIGAAAVEFTPLTIQSLVGVGGLAIDMVGDSGGSSTSVMRMVNNSGSTELARWSTGTGGSLISAGIGLSMAFGSNNTTLMSLNAAGTALQPQSAGLISLGVSGTGFSNLFLNGYALTGAIAVGSLPTCNAGTKAARHFVTDSNAVSFTAGIGAVVAAGGSTNVPVTCDGTNWRIG